MITLALALYHPNNNLQPMQNPLTPESATHFLGEVADFVYTLNPLITVWGDLEVDDSRFKETPTGLSKLLRDMDPEGWAKEYKTYKALSQRIKQCVKLCEYQHDCWEIKRLKDGKLHLRVIKSPYAVPWEHMGYRASFVPRRSVEERFPQHHPGVT